MMRRLIVVTLAALACTFTAQGDTIVWKGITWTIEDGTSAEATTNPDGSLTLTADLNGQVWLQVSPVPGTVGATEPWAEVSYEDTGDDSHLIDMYLLSSAPSNPVVGVGSLWMATKVAVSRVYTNAPLIPANRGENYAIFSSYPGSDRAAVAHTAYAGKRADGTMAFQFDSDTVVSNTFIRGYVGGDWGFDTAQLRFRGAAQGDTVTFTNVRFGGAPAPEGTLVLFR
jgi:hypothetical protein